MSILKKTCLYALTPAVLVVFTASSYAEALPGPLVETEWLSKNLDKVQILDVRTNPKSFKKYAKKPAVNPCGVGGAAPKTPVGGHIDSKNIALVKWIKVLSRGESNGVKLQSMNIDKAKFTKLMTKSGVSNDTAVVITNNGESAEDVMLATRLYWTMKYYGHANVAILNGGTYKWMAEKRDKSKAKSKPSKGKYEAKDGNPALVATMKDVKAAMEADTQLVDSRPLSGYLGLAPTNKLVTRQGHIPTAKSWPVATSLISNDSLTFQSAENIKKTAGALGLDASKATISYSDTGSFATLTWFALHEIAGNAGAKVYDASLNEWTQVADNKLAEMTVE
ncbi:MAG: sulfurtransferase [Cocleimonas sp.]|nr:sulfurtransferase [Cocleimonas sp.]